MVRRPKLRLVGSNPVDIFDDLVALRREQGTRAPQRRQPTPETFARIPHDRALVLYRHIGGPAWLLLVELDRLLLKGRGRNPVRLSSPRLRSIGLTHHTRQRALRRLEAAGVIRVERWGERQAPWVRHLWFPQQD